MTATSSSIRTLFYLTSISILLLNSSIYYLLETVWNVIACFDCLTMFRSVRRSREGCLKLLSYPTYLSRHKVLVDTL